MGKTREQIRNKIFNGNALTVLKLFNKEIVDMCVTSPPYWKERDYNTKEVDWKDGVNELGREETIELYLKHLCDIFDEVKRVLKPYGTLWVNIGESVDNVNCQLIPERFVIEMSRRGWIVTSKVVWAKPDPKPTPAKKKLTPSHEMLYFFVKSLKPIHFINIESGLCSYKKMEESMSFSYYFKQQKEPLSVKKGKPRKYGGEKHSNAGDNPLYSGRMYNPAEMLGRNKRDVWLICTSKSKDEHCAVFPRKLIRTPIDACCPKQICSKCGLPVYTIFKATDSDLIGDVYLEWKKLCGSDKNGEYKGKAVKNYEDHQAENASDIKRRILESMKPKDIIKTNCECQGYDAKYVNEGLDKIANQSKERRDKSREEAKRLFPGNLKQQQEYINDVHEHHLAFKDKTITKCNCVGEYEKGIVLDPFGGRGTTAEEALYQRVSFVIIEISSKYSKLAYKNIKGELSQTHLS